MNSFQEKGIRERKALSSIIPELFQAFKNYKYSFTPEESFDIYDGSVVVFNSEGSIDKRFIIEAKVRDAHYDELILEKKKFDDLVTESKKYDAVIIYISVTPKGSYAFNLSNLVRKYGEFIWQEEYHNKQSVNKHLGKKKKWLTHLSVDLAKVINYTSNDIDNISQPNIEFKAQNKSLESILFESDTTTPKDIKVSYIENKEVKIRYYGEMKKYDDPFQFD
jgi:hypothetical protein